MIDTPISEPAIVGSAIGASYMGMRPVCEIQFIDFIACCFDMLTNFAATSRYRNGAGVPIVVRGPCGGGVGGGPFHSLNPEAFFLNTPGLKMVEPSTAYDAKGLLKAAIRDDDPVLSSSTSSSTAGSRTRCPTRTTSCRSARRRSGARARICRSSRSARWCYTALDAATAARGRRASQAEVIDLRSLAPLDRDAILTSVAKTSRALLLYEATRTGGIGGELAAIIAEEAFEYLDAPIMRVASLDTPGAVCPAARGGVSAECGEGRRGGEETGEILRRLHVGAVHVRLASSVNADKRRDAPDGRVDRRGHHRPLDQEGRRHVDRDEPLFEISTDKVDAEIPSPAPAC